MKLKASSKRMPTLSRLRLLALVLALIVLATFSAVLITRTDQGSKILQKTGLSAKHLTVDDLDYADACALLPKDEVTRLFGAMSGTNTIEQTYLQRSASAKNQSVSSSCTYSLSQGYIRLDVVYYASSAQAHERWQHPLDVASGAYRQKILQGGTMTDDALDQITLKGLDEIEQKGSGTTLKALGGDIVFVPYSKTFLTQRDTLLITLTYDKLPADFASDTQLATQGKVKEAFSTIAKNASNDQLSQKPLPVTTTYKEKLGSTKLLMPCDVLTDTIFRQAFGRSDDITAEQETTPSAPTKSGESNYIRNTCRRDASNIGGHTGDGDYADMTITYSPESITVTQADREKYAKPLDIGNNYTVRSMKTSAAITLVSENRDTTNALHSPKFVNFVSGPYTVKLELESKRWNNIGNSFVRKAASDATYTKVINQMVEYLKTQQ